MHFSVIAFESLRNICAGSWRYYRGWSLTRGTMEANWWQIWLECILGADPHPDHTYWGRHKLLTFQAREWIADSSWRQVKLSHPACKSFIHKIEFCIIETGRSTHDQRLNANLIILGCALLNTPAQGDTGQEGKAFMAITCLYQPERVQNEWPVIEWSVL